MGNKRENLQTEIDLCSNINTCGVGNECISGNDYHTCNCYDLYEIAKCNTSQSGYNKLIYTS